MPVNMPELRLCRIICSDVILYILTYLICSKEFPDGAVIDVILFHKLLSDKTLSPEHLSAEEQTDDQILFMCLFRDGALFKSNLSGIDGIPDSNHTVYSFPELSQVLRFRKQTDDENSFDLSIFFGIFLFPGGTGDRQIIKTADICLFDRQNIIPGALPDKNFRYCCSCEAPGLRIFTLHGP